VTWFVGYLGGGLVYWLICLLSAPPGKPYVTEAYADNNGVIDGIGDDVSEATDKEQGEKGASGSVKAMV